MLNKILKNKILYYVVLALSVLHVLGYFSMRSWECLVMFSAVAYSANCYGKNMTVALLAGLFVSNFVFGCNRVKESFKESRSPVKKARKLLQKAEKRMEGMLEENMINAGKASAGKSQAMQNGDAKKVEGFATIEGNANMNANAAADMLKSLGEGKKGAIDAEGIEKMINQMGGVGKILQAFGSMNTN